MSIAQPLKDYQQWYNKQISEHFKAPKCACGGVMLWSVNVCEHCATVGDITREIMIIQGQLRIDEEYWSTVLNNFN